MWCSRTSFRWFATLIAAFVVAPEAYAWGPHPQITRAVQAVLREREVAAAYFGKDWQRFEEYCLMGDRFGTVQEDFYPDDFLLFPALPRKHDHGMPDVQHTFEPLFNRALQALRTETPVNAARWIGSLLHFTEDAGAPPHAAGISGELHSRLENWIDGKAIGIAGYQAQLLGDDDASALAGFLRRMGGLIEFSRSCAEKMRSHVAALAAREDQPLTLESANETARVCADLLHTLFTLGLGQSSASSLSGRVIWPRDVPLPGHPAKVLLLGTSFSTLTDTNGCWQFRNLPATGQPIAIERCGANTVIGTAVNVTMQLTDPPGNLVRNPDFKLRWVNPRSPDHWTAMTSRQQPKGWESANIRVATNMVYRVGVADAQPGTRLAVRWRQHHASPTGVTNEIWTAVSAEREVTAPAGAAYAQMLVVTDQPLVNAVQRFWFVPSRRD